MRSTLFVIPHNIAGIPLFGFGLALAALVLGCALWCGWTLWKKRPFSEIIATLPLWLMAAAIAVLVLPAVELTTSTGVPLGLPIRGYGVMVLLGLLCGIGISTYRGNQLGISQDTIIGLGFWMMLGGVFGARAFFVIQKWNEFDSLIDIVKLTEGGLVIYGGVVGGLFAGAAFCIKHKLHMLSTADLVAPGFLIGLSLGRIGCLLHGCCFGGVCEADLPSIRFPAGSVPYAAQLSRGQLLGIDFGTQRTLPAQVSGVRPDSLAAKEQIQAGEVVDDIVVRELIPDDETQATQPTAYVTEVHVGQRIIRFGPSSTPAWSLPVHPSQIYACINALLLCLLIWYLQPIANRDGATFLAAIALYAASRFLLEGIRSDEAGQLGTGLTVAQLVAVASGVAAVGGLLALRTLPKGRVWQWPAM